MRRNVPYRVYPGGEGERATSRPHGHTLLFPVNRQRPKKTKKTRPQEITEQFFDMSHSTPAKQTNVYSEEKALSAIDALPENRESKKPLTGVELKMIAQLLKTYLESPSRRTKPTRPQLSKAVKALLEKGSRPLSQTWNKTQLAVALLHWLDIAVKLAKPTEQPETFLVVSFQKDSPSVMEHQIKTKSESGEQVEILQISSPSSRASGKRVPIIEYPSPAKEAEIPLTQEEISATMTDGEASATFLEQFDELLRDIALAPITGENPGGETPAIPENGRSPSPTQNPVGGQFCCVGLQNNKYCMDKLWEKIEAFSA